MSRIAKHEVHATLRRAADHLIAAGGKDGRVSRKDAATKIAKLEGTERALVDTFFRFIDQRDHRKGATVTRKDVDRAYTYACAKLIDAYDVNDNGLSASEITKMSTLAKLAVALVHAQRDEPEIPKGFDAVTFAADVSALVVGLTLMSESDAAYKPISAKLAANAPLDAAAIKTLFGSTHAALAHDIFGYEDKDVLDLAKAHSEERDFKTWFGWRRVSPDPDDPASVAQAEKTGALIDYLAANLSDLRVFAFSDRLSSGHVDGKISIFIVGRAPDGWIAGVFTGSVET